MIDIGLINNAERKLSEKFKILDDIAIYNQEKVLNAFQKNKIALRHFVGTTGYGYGDEGKEILNNVFADVFGAESAICSPNIVSGTHAISLALYGVLRPNDTVLSITGAPYDTLNEVLYKKGSGALVDYGISFNSLPLKNDEIDFESVKKHLQTNMPTMIYMQRSRGYSWRNALSIEQIKNTIDFLRNNGFNGIIMLDNCYGEFIEKQEPTDVGVNLMAGSLIKNPGGGIAPTGGYVCGDKNLVDLVFNRFTAPSIGSEVGSYASGYQYFYQGLFLAPHVVLQAMKGCMLYSLVLSELGYKTSPKPYQIPTDIVTEIEFGNKEKLIKFIQNIQKNSPIDSNVLVMPWAMPGYEDEVIMAAGCFVQGSSIELSADAPIKEPYIAYLQGGLTYEHCKIALKNLDL